MSYVIHRTVIRETTQIVRVDTETEEEAVEACQIDDADLVHILVEQHDEITEVDIAEIKIPDKELEQVQNEIDTLKVNGLLKPGSQFNIRGKYFFSEAEALSFWKSRLQLA